MIKIKQQQTNGNEVRRHDLMTRVGIRRIGRGCFLFWNLLEDICVQKHLNTKHRLVHPSDIPASKRYMERMEYV